MITDAQILKHARKALTAAQHKDCDVALGRRELFVVRDGKIAIWRPTAHDRAAARRRIAALIGA